MKKQVESIFFRAVHKTENIVKQGLGTDEVFHKNEIQANRLTCAIMTFIVLVLGITVTLNLVGVYDLDPKFLYPLALASVLLMAIPYTFCKVYRYDKPWLKILLMFVLTFVMASIDALLSFNAVLVLAIPVVVSSRYYSRKLTIFVAIMSAVCFFFSTIAASMFAHIDLNQVIIPDGTAIQVLGGLTASVERLGLDRGAIANVNLFSVYLPKMTIYTIIAVVCVRIAEKGRAMVLEQDTVSKENSRIETELNVAKNIQEQALPAVSSLPAHKEFDLASSMTTAREVGGDFYDFLLVDSTHLALIIADVSDKGVPAAMYMMVSKLLLDNALDGEKSPGRILSDVNHQLCEKDLNNMFVTVWLGILDLETGRMVTANGGHEYPLICRKNGKFEVFKDKHGLMLGAIDGIRYSECEIQMEPGDTLFVYTDGVLEANDGHKGLYGMQRTIDRLNQAGCSDLEQLIQSVKDGIDEFAAEAEQFDDITMLAFRLNERKKPEGSACEPDRLPLNGGDAV